MWIGVIKDESRTVERIGFNIVLYNYPLFWIDNNIVHLEKYFKMISIIICSINKNLLLEVGENIRNTIGVPYEIIAIDNNFEKLGIAEAYNKGAALSKYDYLCFMHEDIRFRSNNWGKEVLRTFENTEIGLIGACGAIIKPKVPASWAAVDTKYYRTNIIQRINEIDCNLGQIKEEEKSILSEVVILDGLWLATKKEIWSKNKFDENKFDGFHFYDQDFSLQIAQNYKIVINHNILIEHFSFGNKNKEWIKYSIVFYNKWKKMLPFYKVNIPNNELKSIEYEACYKYICICYKNKIKNRLVLFLIIKCLFLKPLNRKTLSLIKNYFK